MAVNDPVIEIDVHGLKVEDAIRAIQKKVEQAGIDTERIILRKHLGQKT